MALTPTQFENLIFDLTGAKGLKNVRWRTPGADGGRDIEADEFDLDFSGTSVTRKWYIECKRHKSSIDWPTIYGKMAYADSHNADFLLMCATSKFTPTAISEAERWNARRSDIKIRLWPGNEIERQLQHFPDIRSKYGISPPPVAQGERLVALSLALSKSITSAYGECVFKDEPVSRMLEAAQAISMLLQQRSEDLVSYKKIRPIIRDGRADSAVSTATSKCRIDTFSIDAATKYVSALLDRDIVWTPIDQYACKVDLADCEAEKLFPYEDTLTAFCFWGDVEFHIDSGSLTLKQRASIEND